MTVVTEFAAAKVNLFLHVLGRREDGFHLLESLVAFADIGDEVTVAKGPTFTLSISGPFASEVPKGGDNIVMQAAEALAHGVSAIPPGAEMALHKSLPAASGIGGGSANAAACLKGLLKLHDVALSDAALNQIAVGLGADVPVCLRSKISMMRGIGQIVETVPDLPEIYAVLVNPCVAVPTGPIFQAMGLLHGAMVSEPAPVLSRTAFRNAHSFADYLRQCRNDLETPATNMVREIGDVQEALFAVDGCLLARMSGSGATCFGLFENQEEALDVEARFVSEHPNWWVKAARLT